MASLARARGMAEEAAERAQARNFRLARHNAGRVLRAFQAAGVSEYDFAPSVGYGYGDRGRETLGRVFAAAFGCEAALVRPQIASGTHAIALALWGVLKPGQELLIATGEPYDTLRSVLGLRPTARSLREWGIEVRVLPMAQGLDPAALASALGARTQAVLFQRSRGYARRAALRPDDLDGVLAVCRQAGVVSVVDNCYGEFVDTREPQADLLVGSLIKNPGGGLAPGGGYVAGRSELVAAVADRVTAPGLGADVGAFPDGKRSLFQGIYLAPAVVAEALTVAEYAAALGHGLGLEVDPVPGAPRGDIVQLLGFGAQAPLLRFAQALQAGSPVESRARPEPEELPGYPVPVVMAGGTFVSGASLELSFDAPMRAPWDGYLQGGIAAAYGLDAVAEAFRAAFPEA